MRKRQPDEWREAINFTKQNINDVINTAVLKLYNEGEVVDNPKWQSVKVTNNMYEVRNLFLEMKMPASKEALASQTKADMPWSEDHFQERVAGHPRNPGKEYKNWPYYDHSKDNKRFRLQKFSHTYMERYWPPRGLAGVRYTAGDLNHLIERLDNDLLTRQAYFAVWHPEDQVDRKKRVPCSLGYHFMVRNGKMDLTYHIRSCDVRRHFKNDIYLTIRLAQWVAKRIKEKVNLGNLYMWIGSLHCWEAEKEMLKKGIV
jgi:thymidylate synthase